LPAQKPVDPRGGERTMETVHENSGTGRARSATPLDDVGQATPPLSPIWARSGWRHEPAPTCDEVAWANPLTRMCLVNVIDDPHGPFAAIDPMARTLIKQLLHHRNTKTGECYPSCGLLAFELPFRERSIRYALGRLDTGPCRQRDGSIVEGLGLIWRLKRWRPYGGQTSNLYGVTPKLLELAGLVLPHDPESCSLCRSLGAAQTTAPRPRRGRPPRLAGATLPLPLVQSSPATPEPAAPPPDPDFETFALVFTAERATRYGDHDAGTLRVENRAIVASIVLDMTAEACAWAESRGLDVDRSGVREDLCRRIARLWLDMPGTNDLLLERRHPIGLMVGDLKRLVPEALGAWKRSQPRPRHVPLAMPEQPEPPPDDGREAEAWPELDASEPTADELAAARAAITAGAPPADASGTAATSPSIRAAARVQVEERRVGLMLTGDTVFDCAAEKTRASSPVVFDRWFGEVQFEGLADGVLSLRARNDFVREWVAGKFLPVLVDDLRAQTGARVEVRWAVDPDLSLPLVRPLPMAPPVGDVSAAALEGDAASEESTPPGEAIAAAGETEASGEAVPAEQEPFTRGVYGDVNAPMAEFLREQSAREIEPAPRRGRSVRTRIALRTRPMGDTTPETEEEAAAPPSEASAAHPRRRHVRSRLGLPHEQGGPAPPPSDGPPDEGAVEPDPPWDDGDHGDGGPSDR